MFVGMPNRPCSLCRLLGFVFVVAAAICIAVALWRPAAADDVAPTKMDPKKVMGPKTCTECHKAEVAAWMESAHYKNFEKLGDNPKAHEYAAKLGITRPNITRDGMCVDCHGQRAFRPEVKEITAVSCESCHGPAGDEKTGWLNAHASYGANGLKREQETPQHKKMRHASIDKAGMIRPARMYALAKNCLRCHAVPQEELVDKAGHHAGSGDFELASWVSGDVAHNFFINPKENADAPSLWKDETKRTAAQRKRLLYVLGKMADLEVSLRNLADAKTDGSYSQAMANRARSAGTSLDDLSGFVPELKNVVEVFKPIRINLKPANKAALLKVADTVAAAAEAVEKNHDGSKLGDIDAAIPKTGKNKRYDPGK